MRKGEQARDETVQDANSKILLDEVSKRLSGYFEKVLNVEDVVEVNINVVGNSRMPVLGEFNEGAISIEDASEAVNVMKSGKAQGLDEFPADCVKKGGMAVLEWLVRLMNASFNIAVVLVD